MASLNRPIKPIETRSDESENDGVTFGADLSPQPDQTFEGAVAPVKMIKIRPAYTFKANIGGTQYLFKKGEIKSVPLGVRQILMEKGRLSPL